MSDSITQDCPNSDLEILTVKQNRYILFQIDQIFCVLRIIHDHVVGWPQHQLWLQTEHFYKDIQMIYVKIITNVTLYFSKNNRKYNNISLKNSCVNMNNSVPFSQFLDTKLCFYRSKSNQHIK